jgi:uncharacterized membrane protein (DUF4010 family)
MVVKLWSGSVAVLFSKKPLHALAGAIGERDMRAIMQFVLLSLVILPVLPHQDFGPYGVWNPFQIWLMVVLIVGISLTGYIAYKCLGARRGTLLAGVLGGLISSTATTVSYARRTVENIKLVNLATVVIVIASCISLGRVLVEMAAVAPVAFASMAPPVAAILAVSIIIAAAMFLWQPAGDAQMPEQKNPAELKPALFLPLRRRPPHGRHRRSISALPFLLSSHRFRTNRHGRGALSSARLVESGRTDPPEAGTRPDRAM